MLTHNDLKKQGLKLSQPEAQLIHSKINGIAQGHFTDGIVYPDMGTTDEKPKADLLKEYYAELQKKNSELLKENAEILEKNKALADDYLKLNSKYLELQDENKELVYQLNEAKVIKVNGDEIEKPKAKPGPKSKKDVNNP